MHSPNWYCPALCTPLHARSRNLVHEDYQCSSKLSLLYAGCQVTYILLRTCPSSAFPGNLHACLRQPGKLIAIYGHYIFTTAAECTCWVQIRGVAQPLAGLVQVRLLSSVAFAWEALVPLGRLHAESMDSWSGGRVHRTC